jgi:multiple sugar transport system permease protein
MEENPNMTTKQRTLASVAGERIRQPLKLNLRSREAIAAYIFLAPFLIFFAVFTVRAVLFAVQMSFFEWQVLRPARPFIGLGNYKELFNDAIWWLSLKNTVIFAVLTVAGTTVVGLLAAVAVTRSIKGQGLFRVLLYTPQLLSVGAVGLIWVWFLSNQFGVLNYFLSFIGIRPINWLGDANLVLPALSLTTIWWSFGFPMLIFIAGLQGIPEHLYEAARIDGASGRQLFWYITLPLLRPTMLFVTVLGFIGQFQVFGQIFIMTTGGPGRASYSVIYYLYQIAFTSFRMGYGSALAIALAVIIAAFTAVQFRLIGQRVEY